MRKAAGQQQQRQANSLPQKGFGTTGGRIIPPTAGYTYQLSHPANGVTDRGSVVQDASNSMQQELAKCEDCLRKADTFLQADLRRVSTGHPPWHVSEADHCLGEAEHLIQCLFDDVQVLREGNNPQAELYYARVLQLESELRTLQGYKESLSRTMILRGGAQGGMAQMQQQNSAYQSSVQQVQLPVQQTMSFHTSSVRHHQASAMQPPPPAQQSFGYQSSYQQQQISPVTQAPTQQVYQSQYQQVHQQPMQQGATMQSNSGAQRLLQQMRGGTMQSTGQRSIRIGGGGGTLQQRMLSKSVENLVMTGQRAGARQSMASASYDAENHLRSVLDLISWVDRNEDRLNKMQWGTDTEAVESQLHNHKMAHRAIADFREKVDEANRQESNIPPQMKEKYADALDKLNTKYGDLLSESQSYIQNLEDLQRFIGNATEQLVWLNQREEEELAFDWSDQNTDLSSKKDSHSEFLKDLEKRETEINRVQKFGENLVNDDHPGQDTIEAFMDVLQTQWSWMLQLTQSIDSHLQNNMAYFQFFEDAKQTEQTLKARQEKMRSKYTADKTSSVAHLEELLDGIMAEKESLFNYNRTVANLAGRAKAVVQLKPRNPANPVQNQIPLKALCEYKTEEVLIKPNDQCILRNNSNRIKWRGIGPGGRDIDLLSLCFQVPPPNQDAMEVANRIDNLNQGNMTMWQQVTINLRCLIFWKYLLRDMETVRSWSLEHKPSPEEYTRVMQDLESNYEEFLRMSQDSQLFGPNDLTQLRRDYTSTVQYFNDVVELWEGAGKAPMTQTQLPDMGGRNVDCEVVVDHNISLHTSMEFDGSSEADEARLRKLVLLIGNWEDSLWNIIQTPLKVQNPIHDSEDRLNSLQALMQSLDGMGGQLEALNQNPAIAQHNDFINLVQKYKPLHELSAQCMEDLKVVDSTVRSVEDVESVVKLYEVKLAEEDMAASSPQGIQAYIVLLKQWQSELEQKQRLFRRMQEELPRAEAVNVKLNQQHSLQYPDVSPYGERAHSLHERGQRLQAQIGLRLKEMEKLTVLIRPYRDSRNWLDGWLDGALVKQQQLEAFQPSNSQELTEQLTQQKILVSEIEVNKPKVDDCREFSERCVDMVKDYEDHLQNYRLWVEKFHSSTITPREQTSLSDTVTKEYMDIYTRYTELLNKTSNYIRLINSKSGQFKDKEFSRGASDLEMALKRLLDSLRQKYSVDKFTTIPRLEALIQDSVIVKEEIAKYKQPVYDISSKATTADQKDSADRTEQLYQTLLNLWHQQQIDMQSLLGWLRLQEDIKTVQAWNPSSFEQLGLEEHRGTMRNLDVHHEGFQKHLHGSKVLGADDRSRADSDMRSCKQHYQMLLGQIEKGKQDDSACQGNMGSLQRILQLLENYAEQTLPKVRTPLGHDPEGDLRQRTGDQERIQLEIKNLKDELERIGQNCGPILNQANLGPKQAELRTTLTNVKQRLDSVGDLSTTCLEDLKALQPVVQNCKKAETMVGAMETRLLEADNVPNSVDEVESFTKLLKQWQSEMSQQKATQTALEGQVQRAKLASERLQRGHSERDINVELYRERVEDAATRWDNVQNQIDNRLLELENLGRSLKNYKQSYGTLQPWVEEATQRHEKVQSMQPDGEAGLSEQISQIKSLANEVQRKQASMDECQKYCDQCCSSVKDFEVALKTYKALVGQHHPAGMKKVPPHSAQKSDAILQEYMDLRSRYNALTATGNQLLRLLTDSQKRSKGDEFVREAREIEQALQSTDETLTRKYGSDSSAGQNRVEALLQGLDDVQHKMMEYNIRIGQLSARTKTPEQSEMARGIQQLYDRVAAAYEKRLAALQGLLAWHQLLANTKNIRSWTTESFKAIPRAESKATVEGLEEHYRDFLKVAQGCPALGRTERGRAESEVEECRKHYRSLLESVDKASQMETLSQTCINECQSVSQRLDSYEERIVEKVNTMLEQNPPQESAKRISELQKVHQEVDGARDDFQRVKEKVTLMLIPSAPPAITAHLQRTGQRLDQVYSLSTMAIQELKAMDGLVQSAIAAEPVVRGIEAKLVEEETSPADVRGIEDYRNMLKKLRAEVNQKQEVFSDLDRQLVQARAANDQLTKTHSRRDPNLEGWRSRASDLAERWRAVREQIDARNQNLDSLGRMLKSYKDSHAALNPWLGQAMERQEQIESMPQQDARAITEQIGLQRKLAEEVELNDCKVNECQRYSEEFASGVKDYEVLLMTFRGQVEKYHRLPQRKGIHHSASDIVTNEYVDLRTRYSTLLTMMRHFLRFITTNMSRQKDDEFAKEAGKLEITLKILQESIKEKYSVDKSTSFSRVETITEDAESEKAKFTEYKAKVSNLSGKAKTQSDAETAKRLEQLYAEVWTLWNSLQGNLQSVTAWQRLRQDTDTIKSWTADSVKLAPRTETECGLERMETHYRELTRFKAQAGSSINAADHAQSERDVMACRKYYKELLERISKESQQENAMAGLHSQLQTFTPRVEDLEREITLILRTLLERDHVQDNSKRIGQQQKLHGEVVKLQGDLGRINQQSASIVASQPTLQAGFQGANQRMGLLNNYSSMALDELKSMDGLVRSAKQAEDIVREYETKLCDGASVPGDIKGIDNLISNLKRWQAELQQKKHAFSALEQQLQATRAANDRLASAHRERDANLDAHQARVQQLLDRWGRVGSHSKMRVQQLENLRQLMQQYFDLRTFFMSWFDQATSQLQKLQEAKGESNEEIALLLSQLEKIRMEITNNAQKLGDYQRNSEELTGAMKNYDSLLLKYRSQIETSYTYLPPQQTASMESFKQDQEQLRQTLSCQFLELQNRMSGLSSMLAQQVTLVAELQNRLRERETIRLQKIKRQVRIMVDGEEMGLVDAFKNGLISEEKFVELANWQGEREQVVREKETY
ncbi:uncharacterized protein LOC144935785 isoform X1 [Lampetra fluviatilis]